MKIYQIHRKNFGKYRHLLPELLKKHSMCGLFSEGCGHCQNMKPAWDQLKSAASSMPGDGSLIEIDSSIVPQIQIPDLTNRISGYPTILLFRNGVAKEEYGGDRSFQDMHHFLKQHMATNSHNHSYRKSNNNNNNDDDTTTDEEHDTSSDEEVDGPKKPKIVNKKKLSSKKLSLKNNSGIKKSKRGRQRKKKGLKGGTRKKAKKKMRSHRHRKSTRCCNKRRCGPECICGAKCNPKCRCPCCK
jgi:hypothetical protein